MQERHWTKPKIESRSARYFARGRRRVSNWKQTKAFKSVAGDLFASLLLIHCLVGFCKEILQGLVSVFLGSNVANAEAEGDWEIVRRVSLRHCRFKPLGGNRHGPRNAASRSIPRYLLSKGICREVASAPAFNSMITKTNSTMMAPA